MEVDFCVVEAPIEGRGRDLVAQESLCSFSSLFSSDLMSVVFYHTYGQSLKCSFPPNLSSFSFRSHFNFPS